MIIHIALTRLTSKIFPGDCGLIIWHAKVACIVTIIIEPCTHKSTNNFIFQEEHMAQLPKYKARTQGTPTPSNPIASSPVAPPNRPPFPPPMMVPPGMPGMAPGPIGGPPGVPPRPGVFPPMPIPGQNMMQQQPPRNMMPLMGRGPNNQPMGIPPGPPMRPPPRMSGPPGRFGPPQRF